MSQQDTPIPSAGKYCGQCCSAGLSGDYGILVFNLLFFSLFPRSLGPQIPSPHVHGNVRSVRI